MPPSAVSCATLLGVMLASSAFAEHETSAHAVVPASAPAAMQPSASAGQMPPASAASEPEKPAADARRPGPIRPLEDPIDRLQRRLAETIGANRATTGGNPYDIRLTAKAEPHPTAARSAAAAASSRTARTSHDGPMPPSRETAAQPAIRPGPWSYDGPEGPNAWARLAPEFAACASGQRQSPIDIRGGLHVELEPVEFDYRPSGFNVVDDGHTVQVNVGAGNTIGVLGRRYELVEFHFHRPSEERIDGRAYDMVAHLVHRDLEGRLAVVAVLLDRGSAQPVVQTVWNNLPLEKGEELPARATLDPAQLLPADRRYYTYMGSMTTPPCSEGVLWMVMKQPVSVSAEQIAIFSRLYPMNARPIQSASGRLIKESN